MKLQHGILTGLAAWAPMFANADEGAAAAVAKLDTGDTAWVLASTALVLLMTPGLAFFYGGMVRTKNVVSTLFQSYFAIALVGLLWAICGYSLAFSKGNGFIGNLDWAFLNGVGQDPLADYSATVPHVAFMLFQCMFAVITPALFTGAFAERMKFKSWIALCAAWSLFIYAPVAHWVWGVGGWIREMGGLDFAGGLVVHMTAGFSALALAMVVGKRRDFGSEIQPYDVGYVLLGTGLLLFGWFGFNGGSALGANGVSAQAFGTTFFAACAATISWTIVDTVIRGKPSALGAAVGCVAGLVAVTPASGFVTFGSAILIGAVAGSVCNFAARFVKSSLKLDDALDVFACHGVGGLIGVVMTGLLASKSVNPAGADGLIFGNAGLLTANLAGAGAVAVIAFVGTFVLAKLVGIVFGLRANDQDENVGLDSTDLGEAINSNFQAHSPAHGQAQSGLNSIKSAS